MMGNKDDSKRDIMTQMADGIAKRVEDAKIPAEKKRFEEQRKRLSGRALEYLMFLDDDEEN